MLKSTNSTYLLNIDIDIAVFRKYRIEIERNDIEAALGHSNFLSTIYRLFSILCLEHHYCGDQQWRSLT